MNHQIGGSSAAIELAGIHADLSNVLPISIRERQQRLEKLQTLMQQQAIAAVLLSASSSLYYFTGLKWYQSERLVGAVITADGQLKYICPAFEESKVRETVGDSATLVLWEEDENPYSLVAAIYQQACTGFAGGKASLAIDEAAPFLYLMGFVNVFRTQRLSTPVL